jgi:hypothetical protein
MKGENIMKNTQKTNVINGITIKDIKPYTEYVATLHIKKADKVINKVVIFMQTNDGIVALKGYDQQQKLYGEPNKIHISEKNNTIRVATEQDFRDFGKHITLVSRP